MNQGLHGELHLAPNIHTHAAPESDCGAGFTGQELRTPTLRQISDSAFCHSAVGIKKSLRCSMVISCEISVDLSKSHDS